MIDSENLKRLIEEKGIKKTFIAAKCGISTQALYLKLNNIHDFTLTEAFIISSLLNMNRAQFFDIFFAK